MENFLALKLPRPESLRVASLGPVTSRTLRDAGWTVDVEAPAADLDAFAEAIRRNFVVGAGEIASPRQQITKPGRLAWRANLTRLTNRRLAATAPAKQPKIDPAATSLNHRQQRKNPGVA